MQIVSISIFLLKVGTINETLSKKSYPCIEALEGRHMTTWEVRELHEWHRPYRWAVHKDRMIVARFVGDVEAYKFMNSAKMDEEEDGLVKAICENFRIDKP